MIIRGYLCYSECESISTQLFVISYRRVHAINNERFNGIQVSAFSSFTHFVGVRSAGQNRPLTTEQRLQLRVPMPHGVIKWCPTKAIPCVRVRVGLYEEPRHLEMALATS
jgi:hypothetical protein